MTTKNANSYSSHVQGKTIYFSKNSSEDLVGFFFLLLETEEEIGERKERKDISWDKENWCLFIWESYRKLFSWSKNLPGWLILSLIHLFCHFGSTLFTIPLNIYTIKMAFVHWRWGKMRKGGGEYLFILYSINKIVPSCCDQIIKVEQASIMWKYVCCSAKSLQE